MYSKDKLPRELVFYEGRVMGPIGYFELSGSCYVYSNPYETMEDCVLYKLLLSKKLKSCSLPKSKQKTVDSLLSDNSLYVLSLSLFSIHGAEVLSSYVNSVLRSLYNEELDIKNLELLRKYSLLGNLDVFSDRSRYSSYMLNYSNYLGIDLKGWLYILSSKGEDIKLEPVIYTAKGEIVFPKNSSGLWVPEEELIRFHTDFSTVISMSLSEVISCNCSFPCDMFLP